MADNHDDLQHRCQAAALRAWNQLAVVCEHTQIIPLGTLVDAVLAEAADARHDEERAALRTQLSAAKMALKGAEKEAEAVSSDRDSAYRSHKLQAGIAASLAKELRTAQDTLARVREVCDKGVRVVTRGDGTDGKSVWWYAVDVRDVEAALDGPAVSEEQTGTSATTEEEA